MKGGTLPCIGVYVLFYLPAAATGIAVITDEGTREKIAGVNNDNLGADFNWKDTLFPYLKDNLKSPIGTQFKAEIKQELMRMIFKEIVAELKEDISNKGFDASFIPSDVVESVQEIKEQVRHGFSKLCAVKQNPKTSGCNCEAANSQEERQRLVGKKQFSSELSNISLVNDAAATNHRKNVNAKSILNFGKKKAPISSFLERRNGNKMAAYSRRQTEVGNVAFTAYLERDIPHLALTQTIKFNHVLLNDGNAYNVHTVVFTAPVDGVYLFSIHFISFVRKTELRIVVDDVNQVDMVTEHVPGDDWYPIQSGNIAIIRVHAGQSVWVETYHTADGQIMSLSNYKDTTFVGCLLYRD